MHFECSFILQVKLLLQQPNIDVNRKNNDRLTSFMLAMQGGPLIGPIGKSSEISKSVLRGVEILVVF